MSRNSAHAAGPATQFATSTTRIPSSGAVMASLPSAPRYPISAARGGEDAPGDSRVVAAEVVVARQLDRRAQRGVQPAAQALRLVAPVDADQLEPAQLRDLGRD